VQCRQSSDCPSGLKCDSNHACVACRGNGDCPLHEICQPSYTDSQGTAHVAECVPDCRTAAPVLCNPGLCDGDGGECLPGQCTANWQCLVDGRGACDFSSPSFNGYFNCAPCTQDAGGCGPNELCVSQFGQNSCQLSCLLDAGVCGPDTFCGDAGSCVSGCQRSEDCVGASQGSICHQGQCVPCLKQADCPASNPGCGPGPFSSGNQCGFCQSTNDCPAPLHCDSNPNIGASECLCHADNECDPFRAPVCIGLNSSLGFPQGSGHCGCVTSADCPTQTVCETRQPYAISDGFGNVIGGACIPSCNTPDTVCATAGITAVPNIFGFCGNSAPANDVCDTTTGYCVPCAADVDCRSDGEPRVTPGCAPFPNGSNPFAGGLNTGGGICGCSETAQCDDGLACTNPGLNGRCSPSCQYQSGVDSCAGSSRFCPSFVNTPFCNTFTGNCQGCLSDHDCIGVFAAPGFGNSVAAPICDLVSTSCVQCSASAQCPAYAPNCTEGFCGFCRSNADCPLGGGWQCLNLSGENQCAVPCVPDGQEMPTDAGSACPAGLPFCANIQACFFCPSNSVCAQCRPDFPSDCLAGQSCSFNGVCQ